MNDKTLIAPCGMNCGLCRAHLRDTREKNYCLGCRKNPVYLYCQKCQMRNCKDRKSDFCDCEHYPCDRLRKLDERYRKRYDMSMLENLNLIRKHGIRKFLKQQKAKYVSRKGIFCVHNKKVYK